MKNRICSFCMIHISKIGNIQRNTTQLSIKIEYHIDIYLNLIFDTPFRFFIFLRAIRINPIGFNTYNIAYMLNNIPSSS